MSGFRGLIILTAQSFVLFAVPDGGWSWFRHWQDLGYLIVYVTGRPDMQKQRVVAWLSQHNFPHGIVSFCDGLVHDPLRHKANFLKSLITEVRIYTNSKDQRTGRVFKQILDI